MRPAIAFNPALWICLATLVFLEAGHSVFAEDAQPAQTTERAADKKAAAALETSETPTNKNAADSPAISQARVPIGLIDVGYVVKNYKKFIRLRSDLQAEVQEREVDVRRMATEITSKERAFNESRSKNKDSEKTAELQRELVRLKADFEKFRKDSQRTFIQKESQIYKTIYLEVVDEVNRQVREKQLVLVLRFSRADTAEAQDPKAVLESVNRSVVFYREQDDITELVLNQLNETYESR